MPENLEKQMPQSDTQEAVKNNVDPKELSAGTEKISDSEKTTQQGINGQTIENTSLTEVQSKELLDKLSSFAKLVNDYQKQKAEIEKENAAKKAYLDNVSSKYNHENYLLNPDFNNLYTEAFNALGTNLDTDRFINLLDKYVNSRIMAHSKSIAAKEENDKATDSLEFKSGQSKTSQKKLRMQDIPPEELESYIAKYI